MGKYHIELTDEEQELVDAITLRMPLFGENQSDSHSIYLANKRPIVALLKSLNKRGAIPEVRLKYWDDPDYNTDHRFKVSNKGLFERNGCMGQDIYTDPHFLPYLRYFLFGAELPDSVIVEFEKKVGNPNWLTSGDILPIGKFARKLVRQHDLDRRRAPEEFFKLCLDMGITLSYAESVMDSVKKAR